MLRKQQEYAFLANFWRIYSQHSVNDRECLQTSTNVWRSLCDHCELVANCIRPTLEDTQSTQKNVDSQYQTGMTTSIDHLHPIKHSLVNYRYESITSRDPIVLTKKTVQCVIHNITSAVHCNFTDKPTKSRIEIRLTSTCYKQRNTFVFHYTNYCKHILFSIIGPESDSFTQ